MLKAKRWKTCGLGFSEKASQLVKDLKLLLNTYVLMRDQRKSLQQYIYWSTE